MTLTEKFENILHNWIDKDYNRKYVAEELEIDADDYAIEFLDWTNENYDYYHGDGEYLNAIENKWYKPKELLEIFKKEREL